MNARSLGAVIAIALLTGCGGGGSPASHVTPPTASAQPNGATAAGRVTATFRIKYPTDFQQAVRANAATKRAVKGQRLTKPASVSRAVEYLNPSSNGQISIQAYSSDANDTTTTTFPVNPDQTGFQTVSIPMYAGSGTLSIQEIDTLSSAIVAQTVNAISYFNIPAGQNVTLSNPANLGADLTLAPVANGFAVINQVNGPISIAANSTYTDDEGYICASDSSDYSSLMNVGFTLTDEMLGFTSLAGGFPAVTLVPGSVTGGIPDSSSSFVGPGSQLQIGTFGIHLGYVDGSSESSITFGIKGVDAFGNVKTATVTVQAVVQDYFVCNEG